VVYTIIVISKTETFGRLVSSSSSSSSGGICSHACSLVHSELSWWGLKSSLHLHVAHTHYCSHYSVSSPYQSIQRPFCRTAQLVEHPVQQARNSTGQAPSCHSEPRVGGAPPLKLHSWHRIFASYALHSDRRTASASAI
jgi:hypothetical protein